MKYKLQWIIGFVIALLLMLPCTNVLAEENVFIVDSCELLEPEDVLKLNEKANQIKDESGFNAMFVSVSDIGEQDGFDYAETVYGTFHQSEPGVILFRHHDEKMNYVKFVNGLEEYVTEEELDDALDSFLDGSGYYGAVKDYLISVSNTFSRINQEQINLSNQNEQSEGNLFTEGSEVANESEEAPQVTSSQTTSNENQNLPYLVDLAGVFDQKDAEEIEQKLQKISEQEQCAVVVVFVDSLGDKTATEFADDYYDYNGYGYGASHDGILLLLSMEERDYAISTTGFGITAFTDAGLDYIVEQMISDLGDNNFYSAVITFANLSEQFIQQARTGEPYDTGNLPKMPLSPLVYLVEVIAGFALAGGLAFYQRSKMTTVREQYTATDYTKQGSLAINYQHDQFINRVTTSRVIEKPKSSGSSTHSGSSGTTHGGTSGSF